MRDESAQARSERLLRRTRARLRQFEQEADVPVLAGPWLGEIAFELLYWLPFLRWAVSEFPGLRDQLVVLSRGGAGPWYEGLAWRYVDLFDRFGLDEFRARFPKFLKQTSKNNDSRGYLRRNYPEKEKELVELALREVGTERINILHPSEMYDNFKHLRHATDDWVTTCYQKLTPVTMTDLDGKLPTRFVAVRFYNNLAYGLNDANQAFAQAVVRHLADQLPLVLLNTDVSYDPKHSDFPLDVYGNVTCLAEYMTDANNLTVQSAVLCKAAAWVGSYGGLSYLAPYYGCPSFALFSNRHSAKAEHRALATATLAEPHLGGYWAGAVDEITPEAVAEMILASR
jgi:hypothetical protein